MKSVCPICNGTGTELVPGKGARVCQHGNRSHARVINLKAYRDFKLKRIATYRRELNEPLAESIIDRWYGSDCPGSGYQLFHALLRQASAGPFTPEQAREILPTLLEVCDEMDRMQDCLRSRVREPSV